MVQLLYYFIFFAHSLGITVVSALYGASIMKKMFFLSFVKLSGVE